jgi:hypothetical protein
VLLYNEGHQCYGTAILGLLPSHLIDELDDLISRITAQEVSQASAKCWWQSVCILLQAIFDIFTALQLQVTSSLSYFPSFILTFGRTCFAKYSSVIGAVVNSVPPTVNRYR